MYYLKLLFTVYGLYFRLESKQEQQKYADIILDFSYFKASDLHDHKIDNNAVR